MSFLGSIFGEKPQIADYTPVNLSDEQLKALEGNIKNWPQIQELGNLYQSYMLNAYETAIPGFKDILRMGGTTTKDMLDVSDRYLHGEIPSDVAGAVQRTSAFQNLLSGGGGTMASANVARNYGLTSMDLVNKGAALAGQAGNAAQRWAALSGANLPPGMMVTPQQMAELDMQQNLIKRNIQQQKYNVAAAPDPFAKALNDWVAQVGGTVVASYLGGGMGGKGGGDYRPSKSATDWSGLSDVSVPGHYVDDTGGGAGAGGGYSSADPFGIDEGARIGMNAPASTGYGNVDLWNSSPYQTGTYNPFGFGETPQTDLWKTSPYTAGNYNAFNFGG